MMSSDPVKTMQTYLTDAYGESIPKNVRERYAKLLVARAVRFYIEGTLDQPTVDEDMYEDEEEATMRVNTRAVAEYPNLDHSEVHEQQFIVGIVK